MVMKKISAWTKNNLREVKHTWERYIAIFAIISIGVAFFAGLVITRDSMVATLDKYLTDYNLYDYRLLSTVAFDKKDTNHFSELEGIESAEGAISIDFLGEISNSERILALKAHSINDELNQLQLIAGKLPDSNNETVVDAMYFPPESIGQTIRVISENEKDTLDSFNFKEYTIVGTVRSAEYINPQRGTTSLASGSLDSFIHIPEDGFDVDYYTQLYLKLDKNATPYTDEYKSLITNNEVNIQVALDATADKRFNEVLADVNEEIAEAELEYQDGYDEYLLEKDKVAKDLDDAYAKLIDGQNEIKDNEQKLIDGEKELAKGWREYREGLKKYEDGLTQFETTKASTLKTLEDSQKEIDDNRALVVEGIEEIEASGVSQEQYDEIIENLTNLSYAKEYIDKSGAREQYVSLQENLILIESGLDAIENSPVYSKIEIYDDISDGIVEYTNLKLAMLADREFDKLIDRYNQLQERLIEIAAIPESERTESQQIELGTIISEVSDIESKTEVQQLVQVDTMLSTLQQYQGLQDNLATVTAAINAIESSDYSELIVNYNDMVNNIESLEAAKTQIDESGVLELYPELQDALAKLDEGQSQLNEGMVRANSEFAKAEEELNMAKAQLDSAYDILENSQIELDDGKEALEKGKSELDDGFAEYEDGKAEADKEFAKAEEELADARAQIDDGKQEIADLEGPTTYIFNRSHNTGYASFDNDSAIVAGISKVLPIFFFLVAALVCSTTMSRMVDEQRTQIGTLKALGYSDRKITNKYVSYAGSASVFGCIVGYVLGTKYFPIAIWTAYGMMYDFAPLEYVFDPKLVIISIGVSLLCSAGVTFITCKNELVQPPAELIRPKSPKAGKRTFLEKIPAIWNRLSFLRKVAIRNIFRFKKRLLMTVMGVAGCTALIIAALGIKDSVGNIANFQFDDIMKYDYEIYFSEELQKEDRDNFYEKYSDILSENVFVVKETFELIKGSQTKSFDVIATHDENLTKLIDFHIDNASVAFPKDGEVLLSHALAKELGVSIGDSVTIKISDTQNVDAMVGGIFENYINNYMYMSENTYEMLFNDKAQYLNSFATSSNDNLDSVAETLTSDEDVVVLVSTQNIKNSVEDTMSSLNYVVLLVLAFAVALAFVVVYNLNNINITERTREIATLKVLGFYPSETYVYVYRENIFLTGLGILFGLFLGKGLLTFVMNAIQVDFISFKQQIFLQSYLISIVVTFLLTILVNLILRGKIDTINMAQSLNSGE